MYFVIICTIYNMYSIFYIKYKKMYRESSPLSADLLKGETVLMHRNFRNPLFFRNLFSKHLSDYFHSGSQAKSD